MADISKIEIDDTIYDVKDLGARSLINELDEKIDNINNEEIIIVGDSYLAGQGTSDPTTKNFGYLLMQKLGMTTTNFHIWAEGGSSFTNPGNQGHVWVQVLSSRINEVTPANITRLIFAGGYNDVNATAQADIETAMSNTIAYAKTNFPNAKIYVSIIANNGADTNNGADARFKLKDYIYLAYSNAPKYDAIFLDKGQLPLQNYDLFESDPVKVHPNDNGNEEIANYFYQALKYGTCDYKKDSTAYLFNSVTGFTGSIVAVEKLINHTVKLHLYASELIGTISNGINDIDLGVQPLKFLKYTAVTLENNSSHAFIRIGNNMTNVYHLVPAIIYMTNDFHVKLQFNNDYTTESVNKIIITWQHFDLSVFNY